MVTAGFKNHIPVSDFGTVLVVLMLKRWKKGLQPVPTDNAEPWDPPYMKFHNVEHKGNCLGPRAARMQCNAIRTMLITEGRVNRVPAIH
jgi:hypothetical protein